MPPSQHEYHRNTLSSFRRQPESRGHGDGACRSPPTTGSNTWPSQFVGRGGPCAAAERAAASERINWPGNTELRAIRESFGIMANYLYDHDSIEDSHEIFVRDGTILRSPAVDALMQGSA